MLRAIQRNTRLAELDRAGWLSLEAAVFAAAFPKVVIALLCTRAIGVLLPSSRQAPKGYRCAGAIDRNP